jgi:hypothetical protein
MGKNTEKHVLRTPEQLSLIKEDKMAELNDDAEHGRPMVFLSRNGSAMPCSIMSWYVARDFQSNALNKEKA